MFNGDYYHTHTQFYESYPIAPRIQPGRGRILRTTCVVDVVVVVVFVVVVIVGVVVVVVQVFVFVVVDDVFVCCCCCPCCFYRLSDLILRMTFFRDQASRLKWTEIA